MFDGLGKWVGSWLRPQRRTVRARRRPGFRPWCEVLEDRRLLATLTVNTNLDTIGSGLLSLRDAISAVNAGSKASLPGSEQSQITGTFGTNDTILLTGISGTMTLNSSYGQLSISKSVTITGPGAGTLTISGGSQTRVFDITAGIVDISGLTITGGASTTTSTTQNGALNGTDVVTGLTTSSLTVGMLVVSLGNIPSDTRILSIDSASQITLTASASTSGSQTLTFVTPGGGAIANVETGNLTLTQSTISGSTVTNNSNYSSGGGGIFNAGTLYLDSSIVGGSAAAKNSFVTGTGSGGSSGAGLYNAVGGKATLTNSTVSYNDANDFGGGGGIANSGTLTLSDSSVSGNTSNNGSPNGGGIAIYAGTVTIENGSTISNNSMAGSEEGGGGGIFVDGGATLYLASSTVSDNSTSLDGGGICNSGGTVTLNATVVSGNTAAFSGGGIANYYYNGATSTLTIENGTKIYGNSASANKGGGIYNAHTGIVTITDSTIGGATANTAGSQGGGIFNAGGSVTLTGSTVSGNTATSGAGIYNRDAYDFSTMTVSNATLKLYGGTVISGNVASAEGGGICNSGGSVTVGSSTITGNTGTSGGGVYNKNYSNESETITGTVNLAGATVSVNQASSGYGGGIFNLGSATLTGTTVSNNKAFEGGGGIASFGGGTTLTLTGCSITGNTAYGNGADRPGGGGILDYDSTVAASTAKLYGCTISGNRALAGSGGGIATYGSNLSLTIKNSGVTDSVISGNTASKDGGGLITYNGVTAKLYNTTLSGNTTTSGLAGGIYNGAAAYLYLGNSTVTGNMATGTTGGAAGIYNNTGKVVVRSSTISGNKAFGTQGAGGIRNTYKLHLYNSTVSGNYDYSSGHGGGGIVNTHTGSLYLNASTISGNHATGADGGGISNYQGSVYIAGGSTISGNSAAGKGGGINNYGGPLTLKNSTLSSNYAGTNGGGIFNSYGSANSAPGQVFVTSSTISGNIANGSGGGIDSFDITAGSVYLGIQQSTIANNQAKGGGGGGIFNSDYGTVSLLKSVISGNSASSSGGGIANQSGTVGVLYSTISGNQALGAQGGGGISNLGRGILNVNNSTLSANVATQEGGGISNSSGGFVNSATLTNCTISGNTAGSGGGIYDTGGSTDTLKVYECTVSNNSSGLTALSGGSLTLTNTIVSGNTGTNLQSGSFSGSNNLIGGNANLYPLANNGGPAIGNGGGGYLGTMALKPGSPAVNAGTTAGVTVSTDERGVGFARQVPAGSIDIGAFQHQLGPTTHLVFQGDGPPSEPAGTPLTFLEVVAEDAFGDLTTSNDVLQFTSTDPQATLPQFPNNQLSGGRLTFGVTLFTSGVQTVTIADQTDPAVTSTGFSITIAPLVASHLVITGYPNEPTPGNAGSLTVFAEDKYGNVDPTDNSTTVSFSSSDPDAILPPPLTLTNGMVSFNATFQTVGTQTLTATQENTAPDETVQPSSATLTAVGIVSTDVSSTVYQPVLDPNAPQPQPIAAIYSGNPTPVPINGTTFLDYKVLNANSSAVAIVVFSFPSGLTNPTLAFFDTSNDTWEPVAGSTIVPNSYRVNTTNDTITVTFDSSSFPTITQLTGTVFTVAIPATNNTPSSTVGVFPPTVSTENAATAVQASFASSSSLSLTLSPLQQGGITTSQSTNTGGGDGDGAPDSDIQGLWDYFNDWWRSMMIGLERLPSGNVGTGAGAKPAGTGDKAPGTGGRAAGAGNKPAGTSGPAGPQSRNHAARDAFFATVQPDALVPEMLPRFSAPLTTPTPVTEPPPVITEQEGYDAAALLGLPGLGLMLEDIHQRRARQRWPGSEPASTPC